MGNKEFNLSDKIIKKSQIHDFHDTLTVSDVKKCFRLLHERFIIVRQCKCTKVSRCILCQIINELTGEKIK